MIFAAAVFLILLGWWLIASLCIVAGAGHRFASAYRLGAVGRPSR
jgi:hypothetical protein